MAQGRQPCGSFYGAGPPCDTQQPTRAIDRASPDSLIRDFLGGDKPAAVDHEGQRTYVPRRQPIRSPASYLGSIRAHRFAPGGPAAFSARLAASSPAIPL